MAARSKDLLEAAAAERSLPSAVGAWMRAVAEELGLTSAQAQYAFAKSSAAELNVGIDTTLELESDGLVRGIPRDPGSGQGWVLTEGNVYVLRAFGFFDTFSDGDVGSLRVQWVDGNNTVLQGGGASSPNAIFTPGTHTGARSTAAGIEMFYQPSSVPISQVVKLRVTDATGTATKPQSSWSASIIQIP